MDTTQLQKVVAEMSAEEKGTLVAKIIASIPEESAEPKIERELDAQTIRLQEWMEHPLKEWGLDNIANFEREWGIFRNLWDIWDKLVTGEQRPGKLDSRY
jgi:hypothetical protein